MEGTRDGSGVSTGVSAGVGVGSGAGCGTAVGDGAAGTVAEAMTLAAGAAVVDPKVGTALSEGADTLGDSEGFTGSVRTRVPASLIVTTISNSTLVANTLVIRNVP